VRDFASRDGAHFVERFAVSIAMQAANVDSLVEASVNDAVRSVFGITHKPVLAALPRRRLNALVIALDVLVKRRAISREQSVVVRWQNKIETVVLGSLNANRS